MQYESIKQIEEQYNAELKASYADRDKRDELAKNAVTLAELVEAHDYPQTKITVKRILFISHGGQGVTILVTHDGSLWTKHNARRWLDNEQALIILDRMIAESPDAEVKRIVDFAGRIPKEWKGPNTRINN